MNWRAEAACPPHQGDFLAVISYEFHAGRIDPNIKAAVERCIEVCRSCPVLAACDADARTNREHWGVRGGRLLREKDWRAAGRTAPMACADCGAVTTKPKYIRCGECENRRRRAS